MRVLWVSKETPDLNGQGGQRRQFFQIQQLVEHGATVSVATLAGHQSSSSVSEFACVTRMRLGRLDVRRATSFVRWARGQPADKLVVAHAESFDLFHGHSADLGLPTLVDFHNVNSRWYRKLGDAERLGYWIPVEQNIVDTVDAVSACSEAEATALPPGAATVLHAGNGVDLDEWRLPLHRQRTAKIVAFGSWWYPSNARGLRWFLDGAWQQVRLACPEAELVIAGTGEPPVTPSDLGVHLVGRVPDLTSLVANASVVIVPVFGAPGTPLKFAEALASGTATVATPEAAEGYPDAPAVVTDDDAAFAEGCLSALRDPAAAATAGDRCRAFAVQHCTWAQTQAPVVRWALG